jgi:hypothetical protein
MITHCPEHGWPLPCKKCGVSNEADVIRREIQLYKEDATYGCIDATWCAKDESCVECAQKIISRLEKRLEETEKG